VHNPVDAKLPEGDAASKYLSAVLDRDASLAESIVMSVLQERHSLVDVFEMVSEAQSRIGDLWEQNVIGIEDEHSATDLALMLVRLASEKARPFRRGKSGRALLCCVEGEFHFVGVTMLAELLSNAGWNVHLLGPNQSFSSIQAAATKSGARVDLICLSVTVPFNIPNLVTTLKLIRSDPSLKEVAIMVGGKFPKSFKTEGLLVDLHDKTKLADEVATDLVEATLHATSLLERPPRS
jgi:methanogenic corrinoid protein MtbC1